MKMNAERSHLERSPLRLIGAFLLIAVAAMGLGLLTQSLGWSAGLVVCSVIGLSMADSFPHRR